MRHALIRLLPGMALAVPLPLLAWWLLGAEPRFLWEDTAGFLIRVLAIVLAAVLSTLLVHVLDTLPRARALADPQTGAIDLHRVLRPREAAEALLVTGVLMLWMNLLMAGVTAMGDVYRVQAVVWHDAALWELEQGLFAWIGARSPGPRTVSALGWLYGLMWPFLLLCFGALVARRRHAQALLMAFTVLLMFHARLLVAMAWPTQGPAFAYPESFTFLRDSTTHLTQQVLAAYQAGGINQNGLYQGLVAMPSLHIGLTALAAWHLAKLWPSSLWFSLPWLVVTWVVTVLLGWHYVIDGVGGLVVAVACHLLAVLSLRAVARGGMRGGDGRPVSKNA